MGTGVTPFQALGEGHSWGLGERGTRPRAESDSKDRGHPGRRDPPGPYLAAPLCLRHGERGALGETGAGEHSGGGPAETLPALLLALISGLGTLWGFPRVKTREVKASRAHFLDPPLLPGTRDQTVLPTPTSGTVLVWHACFLPSLLCPRQTGRISPTPSPMPDTPATLKAPPGSLPIRDRTLGDALCCPAFTGAFSFSEALQGFRHGP